MVDQDLEERFIIINFKFFQTLGFPKNFANFANFANL